MSNQLTGHPWVIDTAAAGIISSVLLKIDHFEWVEYTVETHTVVVTDKSGRTIWTGNGYSDLSPQPSGSIGWVEGLIVSTLGSGKLLVFLE